MDIKIIADIDKIDRNAFDAFVLNHPLGNIYQTSPLYSSFGKTRNYEPIIIQIKKSDEVIGSLVSTIIKERSGIIGKLTARSVIIGGPLARDNDENIIRRLIEEYEKELANKAIYTEIREIYNLPCTNILIENGFSSEKRINILIDLTKDEDMLWKEVHSKRRNEIRRAEKNSITVKEFRDIATLEKSYNILKEVYQRAKLPIADLSLFISCHQELLPLNMVKFFRAFYNNELVGTMYILCYKDRTVDWYAGSKKEHYDKYPNDIITWEVLKTLKSEGYKVFDFGGAGKPDIPYGVRDYKKKFGGEFIELKRYQKIHKPLLMQTGKLGLKLWHKLK